MSEIPKLNSVVPKTKKRKVTLSDQRVDLFSFFGGAWPLPVLRRRLTAIYKAAGGKFGNLGIW